MRYFFFVTTILFYSCCGKQSSYVNLCDPIICNGINNDTVIYNINNDSIAVYFQKFYNKNDSLIICTGYTMKNYNNEFSIKDPYRQIFFLTYLNKKLLNLVILKDSIVYPPVASSDTLTYINWNGNDYHFIESVPYYCNGRYCCTKSWFILKKDYLIYFDTKQCDSKITAFLDTTKIFDKYK